MALTCADAAAWVVAEVVSTRHHTLSERDRAVIELVSEFKQLTARQLGELVFADLASTTPRDRTLKRLSEQGYLSRLDRPAPGGYGGGSHQYAYQLGRQGWRHLDLPGTYRVYRTVHPHVIELADLYVGLRAAEKTGGPTIIRFCREQDSWIDIGSIRLTPDASVDVGRPDKRTSVSFFVELDRGTERAAQIRDKCIRYWRAYERWEAEVFPIVLFLVPDDRRRQEIQTLIRAGPNEARAIFRVATDVHQEIRDVLL